MAEDMYGSYDAFMSKTVGPAGGDEGAPVDSQYPYREYTRGVGIVFDESFDEYGTKVIVQKLQPGESASKSRMISAGDMIVAVNGVDVSGREIRFLRSLIPGPRASFVQLTFVKVNGSQYTVKLQRTSKNLGRKLHTGYEASQMMSPVASRRAPVHHAPGMHPYIAPSDLHPRTASAHPPRAPASRGQQQQHQRKQPQQEAGDVGDMRAVLASLPPGSRFLEDGENIQLPENMPRIEVGGRQPYVRSQQYGQQQQQHHQQQQQQPVYGGDYQDEQYDDGEEAEVRGTQV